jgi:hypothetical protein
LNFCPQNVISFVNLFGLQLAVFLVERRRQTIKDKDKDNIPSFVLRLERTKLIDSFNASLVIPLLQTELLDIPATSSTIA